ncbi:MAG: hypothetical protein BWK80_13520 [Desulfobacteraceae bacterium IS3]|nr:MAG: hypothetical protein BWK80_13520 [Desulfobacteraceae bacterium IS3]
MTIYNDILTMLYNDCKKYQNRLSDIDELKTAVWKASQAITHIEEKELRNFLQSVEGRLDMIQFTSESVFEDSLEIISELTEKISKIKHDISIKLNHGEILLWIEPETGFFIKTVADSGDTVRLSGEEARKLAKALVIMADKTDEMRI